MRSRIILAVVTRNPYNINKLNIYFKEILVGINIYLMRSLYTITRETEVCKGIDWHLNLHNS